MAAPGLEKRYLLVPALRLREYHRDAPGNVWRRNLTTFQVNVKRLVNEGDLPIQFVLRIAQLLTEILLRLVVQRRTARDLISRETREHLLEPGVPEGSVEPMHLICAHQLCVIHVRDQRTEGSDQSSLPFKIG